MLIQVKNLPTKNTLIKPHVYHCIKSWFKNIIGSNEIYSSAPRRFIFLTIPSLHQISYNNTRTLLIRLYPAMGDLVINSEGLLFVPSIPHLYSYFSFPSRTKWYAADLLFFLSVEYGRLAFVTTDWLSQYTKVGSSTGMPIIQILYRRPLMYSQNCFRATNSDPKLFDSTFICFLENQ